MAGEDRNLNADALRLFAKKCRDFDIRWALDAMGEAPEELGALARER